MKQAVKWALLVMVVVWLLKDPGTAAVAVHKVAALASGAAQGLGTFFSSL